jgi:hypothetical protein
MSPRFSLILISVLLMLGLPAAASASDPLLSGYAGPGGGEQVVLGAGMVGGGGGGTSGGGGSATATADESLRATTPAAAPAPAPSGTGKLAGTPGKRKNGSSAASQHQKMPKAAEAGSTSATSTAVAGAPPVVAYPSRAGAVSRLPISAGGVLALVAAIAVFVLAAMGLRRLISPQVSAG